MEEKKSIWNKTQSELTMKDSLKFTGCATLIGMAAPVVIGVIYLGGCALVEKFQTRRKKNQTEVIEVVCI